MNFKEADLRIDYYRDASVHWRGRGRMVHLPSGLTEEFEIAWNDRSGKQRAKETLEKRVTAQ